MKPWERSKTQVTPDEVDTGEAPPRELLLELYAEAKAYFRPAVEQTPETLRPMIVQLIQHFADQLIADSEFASERSSGRSFGEAVRSTQRSQDYLRNLKWDIGFREERHPVHGPLSRFLGNVRECGFARAVLDNLTRDESNAVPGDPIDDFTLVLPDIDPTPLILAGAESDDVILRREAAKLLGGVRRPAEEVLSLARQLLADAETSVSSWAALYLAEEARDTPGLANGLWRALSYDRQLGMNDRQRYLADKDHEMDSPIQCLLLSLGDSAFEPTVDRIPMMANVVLQGGFDKEFTFSTVRALCSAEHVSPRLVGALAGFLGRYHPHRLPTGLEAVVRQTLARFEELRGQ